MTFKKKVEEFPKELEEFKLDNTTSNMKFDRFPTISKYEPFNYKELVNVAKFAYLYNRCGNTGNKIRPHIIIGELPDGKYNGIEIEIYNDGIIRSGVFSIPKNFVDVNTLTLNVNDLVCDWLEFQNQTQFVFSDAK